MKLSHSISIAALSAAISSSAMAQNIGPSTTTEPYILPSIPGVSTTSIFTAGNSVGAYRMVGIPDGIGLLPGSVGSTFGNSDFGIVVNHELGKNVGIVRSHGARGAFVSRWTIDRKLRVIAGRDQIANPSSLFVWNGSAWSPGVTAFDRLCSADLAAPGAFSFGWLGTANRIYLNGEETAPSSSADHGRVFAHVLTGPDANKTFELPALGKAAVENAVASPYPQAKTIVMVTDDANRETNITLANVCRNQGQAGCQEPPSELMMYLGEKKDRGNDVERAGLSSGALFGLRVKLPTGAIVPGENTDFVFNGVSPAITTARFEAVSLGDVSNKTGVQIQDALLTSQITQFMRIEDGAWDPRPGKQRDFYFVTTGRLTTSVSTWRPSRLWRLRFDDITHPENGGEITMLLTNAFYAGAATTPDADPNYQMFDNMTVDSLGRIVLQEDVGGTDRLGRIYVYGIESGKLVQVAAHNPKFFSGNITTNPHFLTNDEESSGVVEASNALGQGWFILDSQGHKPSLDPELVESGQLLGLYINPSIAAPGSSPGWNAGSR
jgi:hypothetical protein